MVKEADHWSTCGTPVNMAEYITPQDEMKIIKA